MSLTKVSYSMINGAAVNVLDLSGADSTGATGASTALQNANRLLQRQRWRLLSPNGSYKLTANVALPSKHYSCSVMAQLSFATDLVL